MGTGDPTDTSIKLRPLEPASGQALARDLVLKTRRRKGLGDQIAVSKYLDDEYPETPAVLPKEVRAYQVSQRPLLTLMTRL